VAEQGENRKESAKEKKKLVNKSIKEDEKEEKRITQKGKGDTGEATGGRDPS